MKTDGSQIGRTRSRRLSPALPVLEHLQSRIGDVEEGVGAFFGLQHLFGSTAALVRTIVGGRIEPGAVFLLGKPYSANRSVVAFLGSGLGYRVHPESTEQAEGEENDRTMDGRIDSVLDALRTRLATCHRPDDRVLLVDDGGRAIHRLHSERYADIVDRFTCVEQTRCGIRAIEGIEPRVPVINVAESWVKLGHESPLIAESVLTELCKQLAVMESDGIRTGHRALVIGYGAIGSAVAAEMRRRGRSVAVYDAERGRRLLAQRDGYRTYDRLHPALAPGGLIVGCTGKPVLDRSDYTRIPDGAILVSASSADVEFRAWQLRAAATCLGRPERWGSSDHASHHPCFSLYRVRSGSRRFYLVNGGFPVNFNGSVDPIAPEKIQLTRGLLYIGAVQASHTTEPGLHELDDRPQRMLIDAYAAESSRQAA